MNNENREIRIKRRVRKIKDPRQNLEIWVLSGTRRIGQMFVPALKRRVKEAAVWLYVFHCYRFPNDYVDLLYMGLLCGDAIPMARLVALGTFRAVKLQTGGCVGK